MLERTTAAANAVQQPEGFAQDTLLRLDRIYALQAAQAKAIKANAAAVLAGGEEPLTVLPVSEDNPFYIVEHNIDRATFLSARLHGNVLDIGAGPSDELDGMVGDDAVVTYLDAQLFPGHEIGDARNLPYQDGAFTGIYSRNCVQADPEPIIAEALRTLNPDQGVMVLASSLATNAEMQDVLLDSLRVLEQRGVHLDRQCELVVAERTLSYTKQEGLVLTRPELFLTIYAAGMPQHSP